MASYRRNLPRTLLPIDRWAEVVGLDPRHFRQVITTVKPLTSCSQVWKQYSWQEADQVGRYDVAQAIQQAENTIAQYLGYKLLPTWEVNERHVLVKPGNVDLLFRSGIDTQGFRRSFKANWGYYGNGGTEAKSSIEAGSAVTYSDDDGDGYDETATVSVATTVTDDEEIAVYYPSESGADEWEIRPLRSVVISGGVATIKMWRHQLVDPDLVEALSPEAVDGSVDANFLTTVDVYRHYSLASTQATLYWLPNSYNCDCSSDSDCCEVCGKESQDACLNIKDQRTSLLTYRPAEYDDGDWTSASFTCGRNPDEIKINYKAGLQNHRMAQPTLQMDPQWERAVAMYALTLLDRDLCDCAPIKSLAERMREDLARTTTGGSSFQINDKVLNNPLGTTRAAVMVWDMIQEPDRIQGRPVRW